MPSTLNNCPILRNIDQNRAWSIETATRIHAVCNKNIKQKSTSFKVFIFSSRTCQVSASTFFRVPWRDSPPETETSRGDGGEKRFNGEAQRFSSIYFDQKPHGERKFHESFFLIQSVLNFWLRQWQTFSNTPLETSSSFNIHSFSTSFHWGGSALASWTFKSNNSVTIQSRARPKINYLRRHWRTSPKKLPPNFQ